MLRRCGGLFRRRATCGVECAARALLMAAPPPLGTPAGEQVARAPGVADNVASSESFREFEKQGFDFYFIGCVGLLA